MRSAVGRPVDLMPRLGAVRQGALGVYEKVVFSSRRATM